MMKEYSCLTQQHYEFGSFRLSPIQMEFLEPIRVWRNAQLEVLRQKSILSKEDQVNYFANVISKQYLLERPDQILFGFFMEENLVGYGGLVHIGWMDKRSEVSFLLNTEFTKNQDEYRKLFLNYLNLISMVAFGNLNLNRIYTETFDIRDFHISVLEKFGFVREGVMREHIFIENKFVNSIIHGLLTTDYRYEF